MTPEATRLRELLTLGGVTGAAEPGPQPADTLDPIRVWSVWQQFAAEHEGDLQAAYGTVGGRFEVSLGRGTLRTTFEYGPEHAGLGTYEASSAGTSLPEFFAEVLTTPGFQLEAEPLAIRVEG